MLGRLTWAAIPFNEPLPLISMAVVLIVILAGLALVTVKGWWPYLWREWLTRVRTQLSHQMRVATSMTPAMKLRASLS
jgi:hypothetical protein